MVKKQSASYEVYVMKKWNLALTSAVVLSALSGFTSIMPAVQAESKAYESQVSNEQPRRNTGINKTLSPNLSCGGDEKNNNVTKGALYGAGSGLVVGGPVGAIVGAGAGAVVQQEQNKDACGKR
jgi:hypothetical protein